MQYKIITCKDDFLRVRFGKYVFSDTQGYGIASKLLEVQNVTNVITNHVNGSVCISFSDNSHDKVLEILKNLKQSELECLKPTSLQLKKELDIKFSEELLTMVLKKATVDLLVPSFFRNLYTWKKSIKFIKDGISSLLCNKISVEVLDATAITASLLTKQYSTASSIMFLLNLSDFMLDYSNARAKNALSDSLSIQISNVWLIKDGVEVSMPISKLEINDVIRVRSGSMIAVDGVIVSGEAMINQATMTGEPLAVFKNSGNTVFAGTVLESGEIDICVSSLSSDSRISKIIQMIDDGESAKASIQGKAERLADDIVPVSLGLFALTFLFTGDIFRALSVLMVDFSCAIKLTTPISIISALREASNSQIVVKGGKYLEILSKVDTIVFDKTGTLTNAVPKVSKIIPISDNYTKEQILTISACLEEHFPHSMASAIVQKAEESGLFHPEEHEKVEYIVAHGIASSYKGKRAIIGSYHFIFEDEGVSLPDEKKQCVFEQIGSDSAIYLAIEQELIGIICINDPPRKEASDVIQKLYENGILEIIMITGDSEETARHISEELGLDKYFSSVLPDQKATLVKQLKSEGKTVLMVGDGINDTPALSVADVSMTLNGSSDIAREVSDIALLSDNLETILTAQEIASSLMKRISLNYSFIVGFNSLLISCGIFGLIGANTSAWLHNASTLSIATLSTRQLLKSSNQEENINEKS